MPMVIYFEIGFAVKHRTNLLTIACWTARPVNKPNRAIAGAALAHERQTKLRRFAVKLGNI